MKTNLLKKNKNILRFSIISKINNPQHPPTRTSTENPNSKPSFSNHPTPLEVSKHRFETKQLLLWFQNSVLVANKTDGGFPTTKGNLRMPQRLPRSRLLPLSRI